MSEPTIPPREPEPKPKPKPREPEPEPHRPDHQRVGDPPRRNTK